MDPLSAFLSRFKKLAAPQAVFKEALIESVRTILREELPAKNIRVVRGVAHIDANPLLKGELLLKKRDILACANRRLQTLGKTLTDLR